jgi:hypothetical protein
MNEVDLILIGSWFLGIAIIISTIAWLIGWFVGSGRLASELRNNRIENTEELRKTRSELGKDTAELRNDLSGLREEMGKTRHSIDSWNKTFWWWK